MNTEGKTVLLTLDVDLYSIEVAMMGSQHYSHCYCARQVQTGLPSDVTETFSADETK